MKKAFALVAFVTLPIAAYLAWTNGELWPGAIILMISWCLFLGSQVTEHRRGNAAKEKSNPTT